MKRIYLIAGNFGVGKTGVVNYYPHEEAGDYFTKVKEIYSLGKQTGGDSLLGAGINKAQGIQLVWDNPDKDFIIHSVFYQQIVDLDRYSRYHELIVFFLHTQFEENQKRIAGRGKAINVKTFQSKQLALRNLRKECMKRHIRFYDINNNQDKETVAKQVWEMIDNGR